MSETRSPGRKGLNLPLDPHWQSEEDYVESLLTFATSSTLFRNLCGGVHILDFLTREPDLYTTVLPLEWREWFDLIEVDDLLQLLMRADLDLVKQNGEFVLESGETVTIPPQSLFEYIQSIRKHCLQRQFHPPSEQSPTMPRHVAVGMKPKKIHEVSNFASFVDRLAGQVSTKLGEPVALVDFGSGQNYLGRTLVCPPYNRCVIAIERHHHNVQGAQGMDVLARIRKKEKIMRNKKEYKLRLEMMNNGLPTPPDDGSIGQIDDSVLIPDVVLEKMEDEHTKATPTDKGTITYVEHEIQDGQLENILYPPDTTSIPTIQKPKVITISLHSCGNLSHHGISSLILNPFVSAIAIVGCCYNLLTERLGPPTYKHPQLRPNHPRLIETSSTFDPHGFPMSKRLETFTYPGLKANEIEKGVRLNITARMMGVQAPYNWGKEDSRMFFRRHFYRALLQRILLDKGVVKMSSPSSSSSSSSSSPTVDVVGGSINLDDNNGNSLSGKDSNGTPLIVGTLSKKCFTSFHAYVRGALEKLTTSSENPAEALVIAEKTKDIDDEEIAKYESEWHHAKKKLAIIWSLMAFSAGVVESIIVVDRWLYLMEQEEVDRAWVEAVWEYQHSPRNMVVVGIKKAN